MKKTLEEEIRLALIMYGSEHAANDYSDRMFCETYGYSPDGSWLPAKYTALFIRLIERHGGKKPKKKI